MVWVHYMPVPHLTRGQTLHNRRNVRAPRSLQPTQTLAAQPVVHVRSMKLAWPRFNLGDFFPSMLRRPGSAVGLLIMLILVGSIAIAILACFAIGPQTQTDARAPSKLQYRLPAVALDTESSVSHPAIEMPASQPEPDSVSHRAAVSQSEPPAQLDSVSNSPSILQPESAVQADSVSNPNPRSALRSEYAAHTESVPLPTRKPKKASTVRRIARPQTRGAPSRIVAKARDVSGERKE